MSEHSRLSPSSMSRILCCPGSARTDLPDSGSAAAEQGTMAHDFCEQVLSGTPISTLAIPNQEMKDAVNVFVEYVRSHQNQLTGCEVHLEIRIVSTLNPEFGGTMDVLLVSKNALHVIDFKFGLSPVSSRDNKQLLSYLALANEKFPGRNTFLGSIVQPRVFGSPECVSYSKDQVISHELDVLFARNDKTLKAGEHCQWCPLKKDCKELQVHSLEVIKSALQDDEWDGEECQEIMGMAKVFSTLAKDAKARLTKLLKDGRIVEGWRLAMSLGNRTWKDEDDVLTQLQEKETPESAYLETKLKSPAQLEKFSGIFKPFVVENTHRPEKGVTAVTEDSKLPLYDPKDMFEAVEEAF